MQKEEQTQNIIESLNPDERLILPYLKEASLKKICEKANIDETRTLRALQFLSNKQIVKLKAEEKSIIDLDDNGIHYLKTGLPERKLLNVIAEKSSLSLEEAKQQSKLSDNEFKAALGVLKDKAMIELKQGKLILTARKEEIAKKSLEEQFLEILPISINELKPEQKLALDNLKSRKKIIEIKEEKNVFIELTDLGKQISKEDLSKTQNLIESLTSEMLKTGSWKNKKFRRYDVTSPVPNIFGGKRHFVNQAIDAGRKIWTELGFKEMTGDLIVSGFWNFDALFTAQDHPVREMQDSFFLNEKSNLPDKKIADSVKQSHETGIAGSTGWQYPWKKEEAEKTLLRTHTTCLSSQTLAKLKDLKNKTGKFFAIGKCFRNETLDWKHAFEFNQTEGIVIDKNANFCDLFGYLREFFAKMGFPKLRFRPSFFPYTEPSMEIDVYHEEKKQWLELGGAGILRPEVVVPLLGEYIPVLAWGPGFDRILMDYYNIKDLRELYENNLTKLREKKFW